jgi:hypothetical protein
VNNKSGERPSSNCKPMRRFDRSGGAGGRHNAVSADAGDVIWVVWVVRRDRAGL